MAELSEAQLEKLRAELKEGSYEQVLADTKAGTISVKVDGPLGAALTIGQTDFGDPSSVFNSLGMVSTFLPEFGPLLGGALSIIGGLFGQPDIPSLRHDQIMEGFQVISGQISALSTQLDAGINQLSSEISSQTIQLQTFIQAQSAERQAAYNLALNHISVIDASAQQTLADIQSQTLAQVNTINADALKQSADLVNNTAREVVAAFDDAKIASLSVFKPVIDELALKLWAMPPLEVPEVTIAPLPEFNLEAPQVEVPSIDEEIPVLDLQYQEPTLPEGITVELEAVVEEVSQITNPEFDLAEFFPTDAPALIDDAESAMGGLIETIVEYVPDVEIIPTPIDVDDLAELIAVDAPAVTPGLTDLLVTETFDLVAPYISDVEEPIVEVPGYTDFVDEVEAFILSPPLPEQPALIAPIMEYIQPEVPGYDLQEFIDKTPVDEVVTAVPIFPDLTRDQIGQYADFPALFTYLYTDEFIDQLWAAYNSEFGARSDAITRIQAGYIMTAYGLFPIATGQPEAFYTGLSSVGGNVISDEIWAWIQEQTFITVYGGALLLYVMRLQSQNVGTNSIAQRIQNDFGTLPPWVRKPYDASLEVMTMWKAYEAGAAEPATVPVTTPTTEITIEQILPFLAAVVLSG